MQVGRSKIKEKVKIWYMKPGCAKFFSSIGLWTVD